MLKTRSKAYWLFLAPALLGLLLVVIVPMLLGLFYSFTNWNGLFFSKTVGFSNYVAAFHDSGFMNAFWFTVRYAIVVIIAVNVIGLGLALLVTQKLKGSNILRTVFFMPNLIGGLILGFI
jgi:raffinose/stachyose/melibiose transport system permease protein